MDAVTYPSEIVSSFITEHLVPLRSLYDAQPLAGRYNVQWTPTLITVDAEGKEHHRTVGYLSPEELVPSLLLGAGKCDFDNGRLEEAEAELGRVLAEYPKSEAAPEAAYYLGVARFKSSHDGRRLKETYEKLHADYPGSEWEKRAYPYRLL